MPATAFATPHRLRRTLRALAVPAVAAALTVLAGCARVAPRYADVRTASVTPVELQAVLDATLRPSSESAAADLLAALPQPDEDRTVTVPNPHDRRGRDTVHTLVFGDLELTVYQVGATGQRFPVGVSASAPGREGDGLRIGDALDHVRALLGEPAFVGEEGAWIYEVVDDPRAAPYELIVEGVDGSVSRLTWRAYLD